MLGYLRKTAQSWLGLFVLVVVAVVFIFFFGSGALNAPRSEMVAEVNGEAIRERELLRAWRAQVQFQERYSPGGLSETQRQALRQTAFDALIDRRLMRQAAEVEGLVVADLEIQQQILQDPYFQDDEGNFDKEKYTRYLGSKPEQEQKRLRSRIEDSLLVSKLETLVRSSVQVLDSEVREAWELDNSTRDVEFIRVNSSQFRKDVVLEDAELDAFIAENSDAISERYERDFTSKYSSPKRIRARHILKKLPEDADEAKRGEVLAAMEGILTQARGEDSDFAALATEHSEDPGSASRGGDLGFFDNKRMAAPFTEAAFALQTGEISEIVTTQFGFHIIKVEEIQEAEERALESVQGEIGLELARDERSAEVARTFAQTLVPVLETWTEDEEDDEDEESASPGNANREILASRGLTVQQTGEFNLGAKAVPKMGRVPKALSAIATLEEIGSVTPAPVEIPTGFVVMRLTARSDPDESSYEDDSDAIRRRLLLAKENRAMEGYKAELKDSANISISPGS